MSGTIGNKWKYTPDVPDLMLERADEADATEAAAEAGGLPIWREDTSSTKGEGMDDAVERTTANAVESSGMVTLMPRRLHTASIIERICF